MFYRYILLSVNPKNESRNHSKYLVIYPTIFVCKYPKRYLKILTLNLKQWLKTFLKIQILGRVRKLLTNSWKASTTPSFEENVEIFLCLWFSISHTHCPFIMWIVISMFIISWSFKKYGIDLSFLLRGKLEDFFT
jgi:hypothetical protein